MARGISFEAFECSFPRIYEFGNAPSSQMSTSSTVPGDSGGPIQAADGGDADAHAHIVRNFTAVASRIARLLAGCTPFVNYTAAAGDVCTCSNCGCTAGTATPEATGLPTDHDALRHHAKDTYLSLCCSCASAALARNDADTFPRAVTRALVDKRY